MNNLYYLGATTNDYDCGTYGSGGFNDNQCLTADAPGTPDTGVSAVLNSPFLLAGVLLLVVAGALVLAMRRKRIASK